MTDAPAAPVDDATVFKTSRFLQQDFARFELHDLLRDVRARADADRFSYVVTPNTDHVVRLDRMAGTDLGPPLVAAYQDADLRLCDSRILHALAKLSSIDLDVMPGSDLTRLLFEAPVLRDGDRVALIGGTPDQCAWLTAKRHDVEFIAYFPPMGVLHDIEAQAAIVKFIETNPCNFYLFTFGAPQSELVAAQVKRRGRAKGVALCVGASVEFITGTKRRAPGWVQRLSLEWLFRLMQEPRRLWRRYLVDGLRIVVIWRRQAASKADRHKERSA